MSAVTGRLSAQVDADDIRRVVAGYGDRGYSLVVGAGCPADRAYDVLLAAVGLLLDALSDDPAEVGDLLGYWLRAAENLAGQAVGGPAPAGPDSDGLVERAEAALGGLEPESARLLRLRDMYDLPAGSVSVLLGVPIVELRRLTGTARLAFLRQYDPPASSLLQQLPPCPTDVGELAAVCDATAPPHVGAELRRHAYRCLRCEETAELQRRARRILGRLTLPAMAPPARATLTAAAGELAESRLPMLDALLDAGADWTPARGRPRRPAPVVVAAALTAALAGGVAIGRSQLGTSGNTTGVGSSQSQPGTVPAVSPPAGDRRPPR